MRARLPVILTILILLALAGWALRQTTSPSGPAEVVFQSEPGGIMGTVSKVVAVADRQRPEKAQQALAQVEAELRRLEALLSTWIDSSRISRFNTAEAGVPIPVGEEITEILTLARELHVATSGAFDITARPLIEIWRTAGDQGLLPSGEDLTAARAESSWDQIRLIPAGVVKALTSTRVDIDGIAKGYAIDRALEVLQRSGARGGMVDVGGDLRLFGLGPEGDLWRVAIRSPFEDVVWATIRIRDGAVCSSGDYARFLDIEGRRYSHIIDPRSGWPTQETHAVTVVGPDAATADGWATALSVLGVDGLPLLEARTGLEAMVVTGRPEDYRVQATTGFRSWLEQASFELSE